MIQIELTTGQKVQMGATLAVLIGAGFLFLHNARKVFDPQVNAHTQEMKFPKDRSHPPGPTNPMDPTKTETVSFFECADGQMIYTEFRADPDKKKPTMVWKVDPRHTAYLYYIDPMGPARSNKGPTYDHAIALAAYSAANGKLLHLFTDLGLSTEQIQQENQARKIMTDAIDVTMAGVANGTFHTDLYDKVVAAVEAYQKMPGDPEKEKAKGDAVRKVLSAASDYYRKVEDERSLAVKKYIAKMTDVLTKDQQAKLIVNAGIVDANGGKPLPARPPATTPATPAGRRGNPAVTRPAPAGGRAAPTRGGAATPPLGG